MILVWKFSASWGFWAKIILRGRRLKVTPSSRYDTWLQKNKSRWISARDWHVTDDTRVRVHMACHVTNEVESSREFNKWRHNSNSRKPLLKNNRKFYCCSIDSKIGGMVKLLVLIQRKDETFKFLVAIVWEQ